MLFFNFCSLTVLHWHHLKRATTTSLWNLKWLSLVIYCLLVHICGASLYLISIPCLLFKPRLFGNDFMFLFSEQLQYNTYFDREVFNICHTTICQSPVCHLINCLSTKMNCLTFWRFRILWNTKTQYKARFQSNSWFCLFSPSHGELKWIVYCLRIGIISHVGNNCLWFFICDWQCWHLVSRNTTAATPQNV